MLSIAGILGENVYQALDLPKPDPALLKIYNSFAHLTGDYRAKLTRALWEAKEEMSHKSVLASSEEAKHILSEAFRKWGIDDSFK